MKKINLSERTKKELWHIFLFAMIMALTCLAFKIQEKLKIEESISTYINK